MPKQTTSEGSVSQASARLSQRWQPDQQTEELSLSMAQRLMEFIGPLLERLDSLIDVRLVRTFATSIAAMLRQRNGRIGLLLSELGAAILSPQQAAAGTKRLSNLLRSRRWHHPLIEEFLWQSADEQIERLETSNQPCYALWDESVCEKPESERLDGLCIVASQRGKRLARRRAAFGQYGPFARLRVPGVHWLGVLISGSRGPGMLAHMRWWGTHGRNASTAADEQRAALTQALERWGRRVVHVFDRGFAGARWLGQLSGWVLGERARFVMRWRKDYTLRSEDGRILPCGSLMRSARRLGQRSIKLVGGSEAIARISVATVSHDAYHGTLSVVRCRIGKHRQPWYLLTNEPITSLEDAWQVVLAYVRRWQIELCWRCMKTDLAVESLRVWTWHARLKLLLMVSVVYAFLLLLWSSAHRDECSTLLRQWCQRTGAKLRSVKLPLYRLRAALSALWYACPVEFDFRSAENSG